MCAWVALIQDLHPLLKLVFYPHVIWSNLKSTNCYIITVPEYCDSAADLLIYYLSPYSLPTLRFFLLSLLLPLTLLL